MADQAENGAPPPATSRLRRPGQNTNPNTRRRSRQSQPKRSSNRVLLEKVLGITLANGSSLACDPSSGLVAYPAGCVIVLLHPAKNKQSHIINSCRKTVSSLAFSPDGKYLVSGESGHMPCVRVWDVCERSQLAEVQSHKYGVACVAFSPSSAYIVSVGYQHDMTVSVWEWKKGTVIASNKVSSGVAAVSFSEDSSSFVTAGKRHVKFWNLDASRERRVNSTVPLIGRSGLLGDFKSSVFCGVACGRGAAAANTYAVTSGGLLCLFNKNRDLEAWVHLKTASARCLSVTERFVFCGCSDGTVRVFSPLSLQFISSLPRPHCLGVQLGAPLHQGQPVYPDTVGVTFDPRAGQLTCVYNDHSVYVWEVQDILNATKIYSALYHSGCVWSTEVYPEVEGGLLPASSFLTCSSDNTIRVWLLDGPPGPAPDPRTEGGPAPANCYSKDLVRVVYVGDDTQHLQDAAGADGKSGVRVLGVSPDGRHVAAGDRSGNLRVFGGRGLEELVQIEAHDSEVLCLEFSPADTGVKLLASASRDRLIHVFNLENNFSLQQTLYDHSGSITAIQFTAVSLVSCGADKSIYFRRAEQTVEGVVFTRSHHVVEKTTLYDMDLDPSRSHAAVACQDRNVRVYEVETGKLQRCLKGFSSDDGAVLKVQLDPSGCYLATSGSDRSISILDYESGEILVTLFGHSEIVTGMKFTLDCRYLISVSGDSCVFLWRLDPQMTNTMRKQLAQRRLEAGLTIDNRPTSKQLSIRRETFIAVPAGQLPLPPTLEEEEEAHPETPARLISPEDGSPQSLLLQTNGRLPMWYRKLEGGASPQVPVVPRGRWAQQACPLTIYSPAPAGHTSPSQEEEQEGLFHPQSLDSLLDSEQNVTVVLTSWFQAEVPAKTLSTSLPGEGPPTTRPSSVSLPYTHPLLRPPVPPASPVEEEEAAQTLLPSSVCDPPPSPPVAPGDHTAPGSSPQRTERLVAVASPCRPAVPAYTETERSVSRGVEALSVELCQQAAQELRRSVQRALSLHHQVRNTACSAFLKEALSSAHADLGAVGLSDRKCSPDSIPPCAVADDRTMELLERYSDLLLHMTRRKLEQQSIMGDVDNPGRPHVGEVQHLCRVPEDCQLACQVVGLQQELNIKQKVLEEQQSRLSEVQQSASRALGEEQDLQSQVSQVQEANADLKREYDTLLECHAAAEQRFRQEKQRGSKLLEDMIHHKQEAAARMNTHNERRSRARQLNLQKDLQAARETPITMDTSPVFSSTSPTEALPEKTHTRLFRSASASSPRILTSIKELFERKRRGNSMCSVDQEAFRPGRICVLARVPVGARDSLDAHEQGINAVRFSSSSDMLATGGTDRVIKLWDVQAGQLNHRRTLDGSTEGITSIEFDNTGLKVLAASYDKSALLWRIDDSVPKVTLTGHSRKVTAARFRSCPQQVVTGSADRTLKLWDLQKSACVSTLQVFSYCSDLVCSENTVISGHFDGQIRLWDTRTASCTLELPAQGKVTSLDLCSNLRLLLSCCRDDCLQLLDLRGNNRMTFRAEGFKCGSDSTKAVFSPDGRYAAAGSADGGVYIWSVTNGNLQTCLSGKHSSSISAVSWSLSGDYVVSVDKSRRAVLWSDI
ncbi:unnamed protein product [Lota lota]